MRRTDNRDTHMSTGKVDFDMLFRSFNNTSTEEEERMICEWLKDSESNRKSYSDARDLHEAFIMEAPLGILDGSVAPVQHRRGKVFRLVLQTAGIAAAFLLICILGYGIIDRRFEQRLAETMNTIYVPAGRSMDYTLQDGTVVRLNSGARLSYPMMFAKDSRKVSLEGEAFFEVAHNAEQPFIVNTFASDITVLGTKFNVKADESKGQFSTSLVEGSVKLTNNLHPGKEIMMHPGQTISLVNGEFVRDSKPAKHAILWTNGIVSFTVTDFQTLVDQLKTSFGVDIVIDSETKPEVNYLQGEFCIYDGIECVLNVLKKSIDFTYTKDYRTGTIHIK